MNSKKIILLMAVVLCLAWIAAATGRETISALKGNVRYVDDENLALGKKIEWAKKEFLKSGKGDLFLTGYRFISREKIRHCRDCEPDEPFHLTVRGEKIKVRMHSQRDEKGDSLESEKGNAPAGLVFLNKLSEGRDEISDMYILDLDRTYEISEVPLFWLGSVENKESLDFLEGELDESTRKTQDSFVFAIYLHDHPQVLDRLYNIAQGKFDAGVSKNAVFWIGNFRDDKSLGYLKKIYKQEADTKLKEQVVFALQLSDSDEAIRELIGIAKSEKDLKVRKNAVFWLGQKASKECIDALQDVIAKPDEDEGVKESAVFAIGQLPKDEAVPMLIDIAKTNKSPKMRKQAMFWLGQTGDDRALKFFEEILLKK